MSSTKISEIVITGDTPGVSWTVPFYKFTGNDPQAPKTYMQGALHADELPGPAILHFLCQMLHKANADNLIQGDITIVPQANPIGLTQTPHQQMQGRFDLTTGTNFNRNFARIPLKDREQLLNNIDQQSATDQLKNRLLHMALGADIVVDLHCDSESVLYTYLCDEFWPDAKDFASAMDLHSVFIADGESSAFDEAVSFAFRADDDPNPPRRLATTLELRGQNDVDECLAQQDAASLFNFLVARDVIQAEKPNLPDWHGKAVPLDNIEVVKTPVSGTILLQKNTGDTVAKGEVLAKIITQPGSKSGSDKITAPQDGIIATRTNVRFAAKDDQLYKIICDAPSATERKPGTLES